MSIRHKFIPKFQLIYGLVAILTSMGTSVTASHCQLVEYSEQVTVQGKKFDARINKCVLQPSSYIVKSEIVTAPDEPQFRNEGRACCCLVDGHVHTFSPDGKMKIRFKKMTKCTCGACSL